MSSLIIDDFDSTVVGSRPVAGDLLVFDGEPPILITDVLGQPDFLILTDQGLPGPPGPTGPQGPEGDVEVYEQPGEPVGAEEGAIWIDTDEVVTNYGITVTVGTAAPAEPRINDIWIDTT